MKFTTLAIPDVVLIEPDIFSDHRGFFMEAWHAEKFAEAGISARFVQENHSRSARGTLRGLHYQIRHAQGKLVRVIAGEVFDVTVDLRRSSPTLRQWVGEYLSAENRRILWVPPGFAHGFYVPSESAELLYLCTDFYTPQEERCIRWNDLDLAIHWPLVDGEPPLLSDGDAAGMVFSDAEFYP